MAFFKNSESKQLYFSPIFSRRGDSNCFGKLCIVPPLAQRLSCLLPFFALIVIGLFGIKIWSMAASNLVPALVDLEDVNVWVMALSLLPGGCATAIVILCQLRSVKSKVYYESNHGSIEIDRLLSISTYVTYAFMLTNIALGYVWLHKNSRYDFEAMPFFPGIMALIALVSVPMWLRIVWVMRKWNRPGISWTTASHF